MKFNETLQIHGCINFTVFDLKVMIEIKVIGFESFIKNLQSHISLSRTPENNVLV